MNREAFEAEYSKGDFGIAGCDLSKHADGSYINDDAFSAFFWFKVGLAHANINEQSQAQQTESKILSFDDNGQLVDKSQAQQPSKNIADVLWGNKALMALNADLGLSMDQLVKVANAILQSQAQQSPKMQFLDRSKEKIITLLWQGICDGTVEAFDVNGMMVIPSEEGMTYVRKEDAISFFGLVEPSQAQQSQWMPIETAPKDRSVMLYTNKVLPVYVGRKRYGNLGEPQQDACEWRCDSGGHYSTPKFWMPIQPAPEGEKE